MDKLKLKYKSDSGVYIVSVSKNKYYYGNGKNINAFGISANQFLRFNPYMENVEHQNVPKHISEKISEMLKGTEK